MTPTRSLFNWDLLLKSFQVMVQKSDMQAGDPMGRPYNSFVWRSAFDGAGGQAFDEPALHRDIEHNDRNRDHAQRREIERPVG